MAQGFYEIDENGVWHEIDPFKKADLIVPIRCKNCRHSNQLDNSNYFICSKPFASNREAHTADWFCADGEWKEETYELEAGSKGGRKGNPWA